LPGQVLFQYQVDAGLKNIGAQDVNGYLRRISGSEITSKDFRTWGGTVCAAAHLAGVGPAETKRDERRHLREAVKAAASMLGNTPAVCKKSYIHPLVLSSYVARVSPRCRPSRGMRKAENAVLGLFDAASRRGGVRRHPAAPTALPVYR
jgi:DNA topoisomerase-1